MQCALPFNLLFFLLFFNLRVEIGLFFVGRCGDGEGGERRREGDRDRESGPHESEGQPGGEDKEEGGTGVSTAQEGERERERPQTQQQIREQNPGQKNQGQRGSSLVPNLNPLFFNFIYFTFSATANLGGTFYLFIF